MTARSLVGVCIRVGLAPANTIKGFGLSLSHIVGDLILWLSFLDAIVEDIVLVVAVVGAAKLSCLIKIEDIV